MSGREGKKFAKHTLTIDVIKRAHSINFRDTEMGVIICHASEIMYDTLRAAVFR